MEAQSARLCQREEFASKSLPSIFSASKQPRSNRKAKLWLVSSRYPLSSLSQNPQYKHATVQDLIRCVCFRSRESSGVTSKIGSARCTAEGESAKRNSAAPKKRLINGYAAQTPSSIGYGSVASNRSRRRCNRSSLAVWVNSAARCDSSPD